MSKDYHLPHQDMIELIPQNLRNPMVTSLVDNLFNRFLTRDEAIPLYGYVGRKPTATGDKTPKVPQPTVERDINGLIPVLSFSVGSEIHSFTVQDLVRKAEVLGISPDQNTWLYSQGNNYVPPIDLGKFTNFFNYYWIAKAVPNPPSFSWNPTLAPEFYTIAKPGLSDLNKLNVITATTGPIVLTGTGYVSQTWTIHFTSATTFTVTAAGGGLPAGENVQGPFTLPIISTPVSSVYQVNFNVTGLSVPLLSFKIVRDPVYDSAGTWVQNETFISGDEFVIVAPFISSTYTVTPNLGTGVKGKITAVNSLDLYQEINGVRVKVDDRILVKNQGTSSENGIFIVKAGAFVRAPDFEDDYAQAGSKIFDSTARVLYVAALPEWQFVPDLNTTRSNTNDWQESNYWIHRDELQNVNIDPAKAIQATRPIIEYQADLLLNTHFDMNNKPADTGTQYEQRKSEFNQVPLYNVYRYDGTHTGSVSPIFFYSEDPTAAIDPILQRRVAHSSNTSADFLFEHGLIDAPNTLLFYKRAVPDPIIIPPIEETLFEYLEVSDDATYTAEAAPQVYAKGATETFSVTDVALTNVILAISSNDAFTANDSSTSVVPTVGYQPYFTLLSSSYADRGDPGISTTAPTLNDQPAFYGAYEERPTILDFYLATSGTTFGAGPTVTFAGTSVSNTSGFPDITIVPHFGSYTSTTGPDGVPSKARRFRADFSQNSNYFRATYTTTVTATVNGVLAATYTVVTAPHTYIYSSGSPPLYAEIGVTASATTP